MLKDEGGVWKKYVCPECGGDNVGESGLGERLAHCFTCMMHIEKSNCQLEVVTSPEDLEKLKQEAY